MERPGRARASVRGRPSSSSCLRRPQGSAIRVIRVLLFSALLPLPGLSARSSLQQAFPGADIRRCEHQAGTRGQRRAVGRPGAGRAGEAGLPLVPRAGGAAAADVLRRGLRARVEDPQQSLVCPARGEEARQGRLPPLRVQRRQGAPRMVAREAVRRRSGGAEAVACGAAAVGGGSHHSRRRRRRRVRPRELSPALPSVPRPRHARMAGRADGILHGCSRFDDSPSCCAC